MIYVKVNGILYPAKVAGRMADKDWDNRESKCITMESDFDTVNALFHDDIVWSIVNEETITDVEGNETAHQTEFDNSEFSIRGDLTCHMDGTCTVKMGKPTDLEYAYEMLYGGVK